VTDPLGGLTVVVVLAVGLDAARRAAAHSRDRAADAAED
jgi:hypothetical protein